MRYSLILPTIGHGATDLIDMPTQTICTHFMCSIFLYNVNAHYKKIILVIASIIHLSKDMPTIYSICFHPIMIKWPIVAKLYFALYHTPLHYIRTFSYTNFYKNCLKTCTSLLTTITSYFVIKNNYDMCIDVALGEYWWVSPIVGHIILNIIQHNTCNYEKWTYC